MVLDGQIGYLAYDRVFKSDFQTKLYGLVSAVKSAINGDNGLRGGLPTAQSPFQPSVASKIFLDYIKGSGTDRPYPKLDDVQLCETQMLIGMWQIKPTNLWIESAKLMDKTRLTKLR